MTKQAIPDALCAFHIRPTGEAKEVPVAGLDLTTASTDGYHWLHFDLDTLEFETWAAQMLPMTVAKALVQSETRPRCDQTDGGLILNLRGVNLNPGADPDDMVSVRLWVTRGLIISARMRKIWAVDDIRRQCETGKAPATISAFLAELTYGLTKRIETVSLDLVETTDELEENSLAQTRGLSADLAAARQSVIKLRRFVRPQTAAINELADGKVWSLDAACAALLRETANRTLRIMEELDATVDRLQAVQDHLEMQHTSALGRNSYVLSVVAAIFLPLGFLTGLFGINVGGMPGVASEYGFWIVSLGSAFIGVLLFAVFRLSKWL